MDRPIILSGARVICYVNGTMIGRVTEFSWNSNTEHKEITTVDVAGPAELAPTRYSASFDMSLLRTIGDGGIEGIGIVSANPVQDMAREKYFSILLVERLTQLPVFQAAYCQCDGQSWSVRSKSIVEGRVRGKVLAWSNEAGS